MALPVAEGGELKIMCENRNFERFLEIFIRYIISTLHKCFLLPTHIYVHYFDMITEPISTLYHASWFHEDPSRQIKISKQDKDPSYIEKRSRINDAAAKQSHITRRATKDEPATH